jgi:hypothetical protein
MQMKMKGVSLVIGLLTIFSLTVSAVNGQPINNVTNSTETESQSGTFLDCYSSYYSGMILWKTFTERNVSATEPELKQFFTNTCNFVHDETGQWLDIWKVDKLKMLFNQVDMDKFKTKYYPQGIPQSVIDGSTAMVSMAGAVVNGTNTITENGDTNTENGDTNTENDESNTENE